jgi:hypothetical protein
MDWLTAIAVAIIYTLCRLFHRHTKAHSRKELLRKHAPAKIQAHLQKQSA